uniref:Uncharacterized protein n=1 Tax=Arundo donax TaxID=35708 RepID=A0A0A8YS51_ARUDO
MRLILPNSLAEKYTMKYIIYSLKEKYEQKKSKTLE